MVQSVAAVNRSTKIRAKQMVNMCGGITHEPMLERTFGVPGNRHCRHICGVQLRAHAPLNFTWLLLVPRSTVTVRISRMVVAFWKMSGEWRMLARKCRLPFEC